VEHGTVKGKILTEVTARVHSPSLTTDLKPWCLKLVTGPGAGSLFELGDSAVLGRESGVDVQLAEPSVSRRHCHLYRKRGGYWVTDLGATNPTRVNGMQVTATPILDGDLLRAGDIDLKLLGPRNPENTLVAPTSSPGVRDALTGLATRQQFREATEAAFADSRQGNSYSLIVLDVDHFKHINDRFGFAAGNRALATLGKILRDQSRNREYPGRIGGEEFALLLPGVAKQDAIRFAERLRQSFAAQELLEDGEPLTFTASFGVAAVRSVDGSADIFYGRADAALYEAKRLGRNRVVAFPDG
jgi:diguanylate cyclase (GGDEF)-like protein